MPHRLKLLSAREHEVLALVASGLPSSAIADRLQLSVHTVRVHRGHLLKKLQVRNAAQMIAILRAAAPQATVESEGEGEGEGQELRPNAPRR